MSAILSAEYKKTGIVEKDTWYTYLKARVTKILTAGVKPIGLDL